MAEPRDVPKKPDNCVFVLFGATGDLARRLVLPSIYNLALSDLLPETFAIALVVRDDTTGKELRERLRTGLNEYSRDKINPAIADRLINAMVTIEADPEEPGSFVGLNTALNKLEDDKKTGGNRLYYMATPPSAFAVISRQLGEAGMLQEDGYWRRLVVEKPFGTDLETAQVLNAELLKVARESQIYRIDHYLGKETVQNILVLRFANGMFEPIWNRNHIDHIQITVEEKLDVGHRGAFYDATGALRDMVPNHLFQLLSLIAMEPPSKFEAHSVRSEKAQVLAAIQIQSEEEALQNSVRAQYTAGKVRDADVPGYKETKDVAPSSTTETYAALKLSIDNWRWAGVAFYLRTGKALTAKRTEIAIKFKQAPFAMFRGTTVDSLSQNYLVIRVEPNEGISLHFNTKVPGPSVKITSVDMNFLYRDNFEAPPSTGYETLLYDCMIGDNMLYQRADSVEAGWAAVKPFLSAWEKAGDKGLSTYAAGSGGPTEAEDLIQRDGRSWRPLE